MFRSSGFLSFLAVLPLLAAFGLSSGARAEPFQTSASRVLLVDEATGATLFEKNAEGPAGLAAVAKIMAALVVVDALRHGEMSLSTDYAVSEDAWRRGGGPSGGPSMFADLNSRVAVVDLLRGLMVQGGNDASLILAEGIAGSEQAFVERMNRLAAKIGLNETRFSNATGKADAAQATTLRDASRLALHFQKTYPEWYKIYGEKEFTWNKVRQLNRNPLIGSLAGADGLAVASADSTSFDLIGSARREGRHFMVIVEAKSAKERNEEAKRLLEWGFDAFRSIAAYKPGEIVGAVRVFGGESPVVAVAAATSIHAILPKDNIPRLEGRILYQGPLPAPIKVGDSVGVLRLTNEGKIIAEIPVYAAAAVAKGGFWRRAVDASIELWVGLIRGGASRS